MSGPGWMPSRPRPLGFARKRLVRYLPRRISRRAPGERIAVGEELACGRFFHRRQKLPVATLLPTGRRVLGDSLHGWLGQRWTWAQPRLIPLIFAFCGCIAMLNARRYLLELARGPAIACNPGDAAAVLGRAHDMLAAPDTYVARAPHVERCVVDRWR